MLDSAPSSPKGAHLAPAGFQRFWFFAAGLTNVEVQIDVTDTETGITRTYTNPINQPFTPIQDTEGFDTCAP